VSARAVWAAKRPVTKPVRSGIIKYPITQADIDRLISNELKGIRFPVSPVYNGRIKDMGRTDFFVGLHGERIGVDRILIGKQVSSGDAELLDTLLHERLESKICLSPAETYKDMQGDDVVSRYVKHQYIAAVISRYFRMREWSK
jgi:hypothetical protein